MISSRPRHTLCRQDSVRLAVLQSEVREQWLCLRNKIFRQFRHHLCHGLAVLLGRHDNRRVPNTVEEEKSSVRRKRHLAMPDNGSAIFADELVLESELPIPPSKRELRQNFPVAELACAA